MTKGTTITFRLIEEDKLKLKEIANEKDISVSKLVCNIIRDYLKEKKEEE